MIKLELLQGSRMMNEDQKKKRSYVTQYSDEALSLVLSPRLIVQRSRAAAKDHRTTAFPAFEIEKISHDQLPLLFSPQIISVAVNATEPANR